MTLALDTLLFAALALVVPLIFAAFLPLARVLSEIQKHEGKAA